MSDSDTASQPETLDSGRSLFQKAKKPALIVSALFFLATLPFYVYGCYYIPSPSMLPALHPGDFILVDEQHYGYKWPFSRAPIFGQSVPERGDIVIFVLPGSDLIDPERYSPENPYSQVVADQSEKTTGYWWDFPFKDEGAHIFVKRVVGLPGDTIVVRDMFWELNGEEIQIQRDGDVRYHNAFCNSVADPTWIEDLPNRDLHITQLDWAAEKTRGEARRFEVPADHVFVMGDNRDHSTDSRTWGYLPLRNVVGKAGRFIMAARKCGHKNPGQRSFLENID